MGAVDPRFESSLDRSIREATERGDFDNLPRKGKPLPDAGRAGPLDENWWIRGYLEREGLSGEAMLPPSVQLRKELDRIDETVAKLRDERRVRDRVEELNSRVVDHLRFPSGPWVPIRKLDADEVVARWRAARGLRTPTGSAAPTGSGDRSGSVSGTGASGPGAGPTGRETAAAPAADSSTGTTRSGWWSRLWRRG